MGTLTAMKHLPLACVLLWTFVSLLGCEDGDPLPSEPRRMDSGLQMPNRDAGGHDASDEDAGDQDAGNDHDAGNVDAGQ